MDESNWLFDGLNTNRLACPVSGQAYDVTYVVGTHPQCPTHGDLIQFYGYVPHHQTPRSAFWWFTPPACVLGVVVFGVWSLISLVAAKRRKKREEHNKTVHSYS
jgi:hypothetical protein